MTVQPTEIGSTDWVHLEGMAFYGYHGVDPAEKQLGQRFIVDLSAAYDLRRAGRTDDLRDTVNYAQLFRLTRDIVEGPSCDLLEAVAARIAESVFANTPVDAVRVRL
ncbi:MAG: dihydroneopterin aldolase, partial [Dehalococcoidia bacterium]|nr:dihydroneopterin aldolase [Dehalococcoidia bacterium]